MTDSIQLPEVKKGLKYCFENSLALIQDAELLFENDSYARAYSITQLAIEEIGKARMVFDLYMSIVMGDRKEFDFPKFRKNFRDHKWKTVESKISNIYYNASVRSQSTQELEEFALKNFAEMQKAKNGDYDKLKNNGFYVSIENNSFCSPKEMFNREETLVFIQTSKKQIEFSKDDMMKWIDLDERLGIDKENALEKYKT